MAQRLQAVESTRRQLFGDLAHEIRTPVSVLEAYLEAVEDGVKTLDPQTIAMLREQTGRLVRFSADAAALAQAEEAHTTITPEWVDAGRLVAAVTAAVADRYAAKGVAADHACRRRAATLGRRQRLTQVLGNLLDNALRHTPAGGHVTIAVGPRAPTWSSPSPTMVKVSPPNTCPHLFERFYRADTARTATKEARVSGWRSPKR